jgi:MFS family permease
MSVGSLEVTTELARARPSRLYAYYVLGMLMLVGGCSWTDRQLFSILLQVIKQTFSLSDTQLGLLGGTAFALLNVTIALPIAWVADKTNRRNIIAFAVALWSCATFLCGLAGSYGALFLCRMGVGIGEAGASAPSQSMVSDYFPARHRAMAMGVLLSYVPIGYLVSYSLGGWLNDSVGWRSAFALFGIPGLLLAVLFRFTVREPERGGADFGVARPREVERPAFLATIRYFLSRRSLRHIPLGGAAHGIGMFGAAVWMPAYFMRTYHMSSAAVGLRLAFIMGLAGTVGALSGGHVVDWLVAKTKDVRWFTRSCGLFLLASVPFSIGVFTVGDANTAFLLFIVPSVLNHMILGPVVASCQELAGVRRRTMAAAFYLFLVNLVSSSLGPLLVGMLSDVFQSAHGTDSLRYSLLVLIPATAGWGAIHFLLSTRTVAQDHALAQDAST